MIVLIDTGKATDKIQYPFMIKIHSIPNGEGLKAQLLRLGGKKHRFPFLPPIFNIKLEVLSRIIRKEKQIKGHEEPSGKTGIKTQTYQRMDLRIWGGGGVRCDRVRECHGDIYTTKCKKIGRAHV